MAEDSLIRLTELLKSEALIDPAIVDFVTKQPPDGLGMASVSDFASYFTASTYESGVEADILDQTSAKGNRLQLGRLRTAWRMCAADLQSALSRKSEGLASEDPEAPLFACIA